MTVARVITDVLAPAHLTIALLVLVAVVSAADPVAGLGWGALAALFVGVIPYGFLLIGVRRGRYSDRHVRVRRQRTAPLAFGLGSALTGVVVLAVAGAPAQLLALVVAGLVGLGVTLSVTLVWKMSVHTAVASGTATILTLVFGPPLLVSWPLVAAVGWSRLVLRDHTVAQVLVGAALGAAVAGTVFSALQ